MIGRFALALTGGLLAVHPASAADAAPIVHGPEAVAHEIIAADHAFSVESSKIGTAKAFRQFMDGKDGLKFDGGEPKRGSQEIYDAEGGDAPRKSTLTWEPAEVFAATSGDMGATWGHWVMKYNDPAKKALTGHYVTVWRKTAADGWKGVIDIGDVD
jgi:ketosteroid isomerase-like protein